ncbi:MAG: FAD-dependent oxidoreductase [Rhodobacter sp.]|nr:FAD-dependent oxidoreductase [Rhodobacter sp.]MCY4167638.1 FAD-dependent oxidoreductase [Rhodobacter sp.]MCY4240902.1 FAD-dependent oxidoreductase [Rhodobacter sp.]
MIDVTVMGGGVLGLSVAYVCARRGARVCIVEKRSPAAGASGGPLGALAPHVPDNWNEKKEFQFRSLLMAETFWREVERDSGRSPGFRRTGRLQAIANPRALELAHARRESARRNWRAKADWRVAPASEFGAWCPTGGTGYVIHDTLSARLEPRNACESLAGAILELGGEIRLGEVPAGGQVIWATGYEGLRDLSGHFDRLAGDGIKGQALSLQYDAGDVPQLFIDGVHIVPHENGTVAVGSTDEREFASPDSTDWRVEALLNRAVGICPTLRGAPVLTRWAGVRPRAKSRAPVIGPWPGRNGHFIVNGGFKIGFGIAPKVAGLVADLVLEGRDVIPSGFRVEDCLGL